MKGWHRVFLALIPLVFSGCVGCEQVDEGFRGIETNFGKVVGEPLPPGLHFYNPCTSEIDEIDVREKKLEGKTGCYTADTQLVEVTYAMTYYPDHMKIGEIYKQFGWKWEEKIIDQAILGAIKDVVGQYKADDLVSKREQSRKSAETELKGALSARGVILTKLDLTNLDFDDAYEKAVEAKVVATQRAIEAKNKTVQIEEEAKQKVKTAEAEATAMRIKSQALAQNKGLVQFEIAQKWDGKLPEIVMGSGSIPMIDLKGLKQGD